MYKPLKISTFLFLIFFLFSGLDKTGAQEITASAPSVVQNGKAFAYALNGEIQGRIELPEMKGIRVVAGPGQSITSQSSNINGRLESVTKVTYTFMLIIDEEGTYEIPPAKIISSGKEYKSNSLKITAIKGTGQVQTTQPAVKEQETVMIRQQASRRNIYLGEQIVIETKVYVRENLQVTGLEEPKYNSFWRQEIEADNFVGSEVVNGHSYRTQIIKRDLLTAQKTGEIVIEPAKMDVLLRKRVSGGSRSRGFDDIFDDPFFRDPFERYENVPASYSSNPITINVKPLPVSAPASFYGATGNFTFSAEISRDSTSTNESLRLKISIKGKGNLDLLQAPKVDFPPGLEVFEPKSNAELNHTVGGTSGIVSYEYLIIPRKQGNYRIAPVEFSYFDPQAGSYKTIKSKEFNILVSGEGEETGVAGTELNPQGFFREEVKNIESDILYIKTDPGNLKRKSENILDSLWMLIYPAGVILFIILLFLRRSALKKRADKGYLRNRKASKIARKRLKNARSLMQSGNEDFYEEVLKAFWGYLSDKLGMNTSELSRDKIDEKLSVRNIPAELLRELKDILDECEFSRFAPGIGSDMKTIYKRAENCLSKVEEKI